MRPSSSSFACAWVWWWPTWPALVAHRLPGFSTSGCGIGATAQVLRDVFPAASLEGIDASSASIDAARALGVHDAQFHLSKDNQLPFASGSFDLIYSNGTFHHIDHGDHPSIFAELSRVLRPGGQAFIFENNPLNPLTVWGMRQNPFDRAAKLLFPWYLRRLLHHAGLHARAPQYFTYSFRSS